MRPTPTVLFVALALAGCGDPQLPATTAQSAATALGAVLPRDMGGGMIVSSASASGAVLVLKLDNMVDRGTKNAAEVAGTVKPVACRDEAYRTLVSQGITIRFEPTDTSGRELPAVTLDDCNA